MKQCCDTKPKFQIKYDSGLEDSEWLLCETHYNSDPVFKKHIKTILEIEK